MDSGYSIPASSTTVPFKFRLRSSSDHVTPVTGAAPAVTLSVNGGAFRSPAGPVSEIGSGWYQVTPAGANNGTPGVVTLVATAAGADQCDANYQIATVERTLAAVAATHGGTAAAANVKTLSNGVVT